MNNKWNAYDELALLAEEFIDNMIAGSEKPINALKAYQACQTAMAGRVLIHQQDETIRKRAAIKRKRAGK